jgi:hypothetical protein
MRDTIDMAREAGIEFQRNMGLLGKETISTMGSQRLEKIERLVALVRADEREACAKSCESFQQDPYEELLYKSDFAAAIRARSNT